MMSIRWTTVCAALAVLAWCLTPLEARADDEWVCVYDLVNDAHYAKADYTHEEATEACELDHDALCVCDDVDSVDDDMGWEIWTCETHDGDEEIEYLKVDYTEDEARDECEDDTGRDCDCED